MTSLFIDSNNQYPRHIGDLLIDFPNWDGNIENLPDGWNPVFISDIPEINEGEFIEEEFPQLINGKYFQKFNVKKINNDDLDMKNKIKISYLLANSEGIPLSKQDEYGLN